MRGNVVHDNATSISVVSLANPDLETQDDPGLNQLVGSGRLVHYLPREEGRTLMAKHNWWGISPPDVGRISPGVLIAPSLPQPPTATAAWRPLAQLPLGRSIQSMAATDDGVVYVGEEGGTVYRVDAGDARAVLAVLRLPGQSLDSIAVVGGVVFVAGWNAGIWRSSDQGASWRPVHEGKTEGGAMVAAVVGPRLYLGNNAGIAWTDDLGETWDQSTVLEGRNTTAILVTPRDIYAGARADGGVYGSPDVLAPWSPLGLAGAYITSLGYAAGALYATEAGRGARVTRDGGQSWIAVPGVRLFRQDGSDLYAVGTTYHITRWSVTTGAWVVLTDDLPGHVDHSLPATAIRNGVVYAATDDGALYSHRLRGPRAYEAAAATAPQMPEAVGVHIPDADLEQVLREAVDKPTGLLSVADIAGVIALRAAESGVASLGGLEHVAALRTLDVNSNRAIADLGPLAGLTELRDVDLHFNRITDIRPLAGLTNIEQLNLAYNGVSDVRALASLTPLQWLDLVHNEVADLAPLLGLGALRTLRISENPLDARSMTEHLPELVRRGVDIDIMSVAPDAATPTAVGEASASLPPVVTSSPSRATPPSTALIVGANAYIHHADLANPTFDANAVTMELREVYHADTTTLLDATKVGFLTALHALADREYADDEQLQVFFSGHGYFDDRIRRGYLALKDSLPLADDPLMQSYVSHEDVRVLLERLDCNHVLLVVDSCFSGTLDPMVAMGSGARPIGRGGLIPKEEYIQRKLRYRTRRYITAGGKEYVPDGRPGQHSPFARQFLAALRTFGGSDGILTLEEIILHLERVDPEPRTGELYGNEPGSSFVLGLRSLSRARSRGSRRRSSRRSW